MPAFHIKSPVLPVKDQVAGAIQWDYDYAEVRADGIVHALGVVFSLVATTALVFIVTHYPTAVSVSAVLVYSRTADHVCYLGGIQFMASLAAEVAASTLRPFRNLLADRGNLHSIYIPD